MLDRLTGTHKTRLHTGGRRFDLLTIVDNPSSEAATFNLFLQRAGGGFELPRRVEVASRAGCGGAGIVQLVDMNGDGKPDLAVVSASDESVQIVVNLGQGRFATDALHALKTEPLPVAIAAVDMNGDLALDLVLAHRSGGQLMILYQR